MALPCKHEERVTRQVQPTIDLLSNMDVLHPEVLLEHTIEPENKITLDSRLWQGSFNGRESTLHQLSPYVGKLKSGMVNVLIRLYSEPGDTILDPFSGSGVVPFQAVLMQRRALANDLSLYAYVLTRGKLETPESEAKALTRAATLVEAVEKQAPSVDVQNVPDWVREFFHPKTLKEVLAAFRILKE